MKVGGATASVLYNLDVNTPPDRFASFVAAAQARSAKQFRFSLLVALVIAVLIWRTQWIALRPGLYILLTGQVAVSVAYYFREQQLQRSYERSGNEQLAWFDSEARFVQLISFSDSAVRLAGFVVLGYGFWNSTHILWITLLLGVAYPVISYFGVTRRNVIQTLKLLASQRDSL